MKASALGTAGGAIIAMTVVVLVSWALVGHGIAQALAKTSPELALRFHGANPEALVRINESEPDAVAKARRARLVLARRPVDGRAYRQLAEIEEAAGRTQAAGTLFRVAVRNTPRDRLAQAWMADDALARGAASEAVERLVLLADMDATLWPRLFPYLRELSLREPAWAELIEQLVSEPPWRSQFLSAWERERPASFDPVMLALEGKGARLTDAERELWVQHLIRGRRWTAAYLAWTGGLETSQRLNALGVFNGGFEFAPAGHFDWSLAVGNGNQKDLLSTAGASGKRALRIQFSGKPGTNVEQILVLSPGAHVFRARTRLEGLRSERGLVWSVSCVPDQQLLGAGPALGGTREWHWYDFSFNVPEGCEAQRLTLELRAKAALERRIEGVVWLDDVAITKVVNENSGTPKAHATGANGQITARAGVPAALLVRASGRTMIEREGRTIPADVGALLLHGDRVAAVPPGTVTLRWRDHCQKEVAAVTVTLLSPCSPLPLPSLPSLQRRGAVEIVRASLGEHPGVPGSSGADLPVGP